MDCPFCNIDKEKTRIIKKSNSYYITLSNPRLIPGHLLVIPHRHVEKPSQLNPRERREIFNAIVDLEEQVLQKLSTGCDIRTNYRPFLKQGRVKVDHLHFHLQPREFEDELYQKSQKYEYDLWKDLSDEEREKFVKLFGNE